MEVRLQKLKCFVFVILLGSCDYINTPIKRNDIYSHCAKGDTISFAIFRRSQRIIKSQDKYFIWYDLYEDENLEDQYALHLLICDNNLILLGAAIDPGASIEYVKGDTLFGWIENKNWKNEKLNIAYRNDLPSEIRFELKVIENWNGYQIESYTIIDSLQFLSNKFSVVFHTRVSEDKYAWPGKKEYLKDVEFYSKMFNHEQVIEVPISSLYFPRSSEGNIYIINCKGEKVLLNEMAVLNNAIKDKLFKDIWASIKLGNKR